MHFFPNVRTLKEIQGQVKKYPTLNFPDAVFFDIRGIVLREYAPVGQTVTKEYYQQVLRRLRDAVRRKRPDLWTAKNWQMTMLQHIHRT